MGSEKSSKVYNRSGWDLLLQFDSMKVMSRMGEWSKVFSHRHKKITHWVSVWILLQVPDNQIVRSIFVLINPTFSVNIWDFEI